MNLISIVIPNFSGGGAEKVMTTLANSLHNQGYKVDLVVFSNSGAFVNDIHHEVNIVNLSTSRASFTVYSLVQYISHNRPDVILSALTHVNIATIIAKFFSRVDFRLVISEHAVVSVIAGNTKQLKEKLYPFFMKLLYRFSDHIITVSEAVLNDVVSITSVDLNQITTIYNPIDIQRIKNNVKKSTLTKKSIYQIIAVGRLTQEKDFITLIKAFYLVKKEIDACLVILGDGGEYSKIKECIKKYDLEKSVSMLGFVDKPETHIIESDLLCVSSVSEGFGNVIVEALVLGIPVIATDCGGPREILEDGLYGNLVPVGDYKTISKEMIKAITVEQNLPTIKHLENRFGVAEVTSKYLEVLLKNE